MEKFAIRLKKIRKEHNLTQKQVAEYVNVTQQTYNNYETKDYEPTIETLIKLAKLFNTTIDNLIGNTTTELYTQNNNPFIQELTTLFKQLTPIGQGQVLGYTKKTLENEQQNKQGVYNG